MTKGSLTKQYEFRLAFVILQQRDATNGLFSTLNFVDILLFQVWEILQIKLQHIFCQHTSELELVHISLEETQVKCCFIILVYIFPFILSFNCFVLFK